MFYKVWFVAVIFTIVFATVSSGNVRVDQCPGQSFEDLQDRIQVEPCGKSTSICNLQKETNVTVTIRFSLKKDIKSLTNDVSAKIAGLPVPFFGVDGTDACQHVKRAGTDEYVSCPLVAGQDYVYTNTFPILPIYPSLNTLVHWALKAGKEIVICFEVNAAIINAKKSKKN